MTAKEILIKGLKDAGYDGLCDLECGCFLDDLIPCGNDPSCCEAGVERLVNDCRVIEPMEFGGINYEPII